MITQDNDVDPERKKYHRLQLIPQAKKKKYDHMERLNLSGS